MPIAQSVRTSVITCLLVAPKIYTVTVKKWSVIYKYVH